MHASHRPHAPSVSGEKPMPQERSDEPGSIPVKQVQPDEAISAMHQFAPKVVLIVRKEGDMLDTMEDRNDLGILNARMFEIYNQAPKLNAPFAQLITLILSDVFIQQIHAARRKSSRRRKRPCASRSERRAIWTHSAMPTREIRPPQAFTISSGVMPCASSSRICQTIIRVPFKVGLPWQTSGSATMCSPSSTRRVSCLAGRLACFIRHFMTPCAQLQGAFHINGILSKCPRIRSGARSSRRKEALIAKSKIQNPKCAWTPRKSKQHALHEP